MSRPEYGILQAARLRARKAATYFDHTFIQLGYLIDERCVVGGEPCIGVTEECHLLAHPQFIQECVEVGGGIPALGFVLLHEDLHVMFKHPKRARKLKESEGSKFDERASAIAMDISINWILRALARSVEKDPKGFSWICEPIGKFKGHFPEDHNLPNGLDYEKYYNLLKKKTESEEKDLPKPSPGTGAGDPAHGDPMENLEELKKELEEKGFEPKSDRDIDSMMRETEKLMRGPKPGTIPAGLLQQVQTALEPSPTDWREHFRSAISTNVDHRPGHCEHLFAQPNRRQATLGWGVGCAVLPGIREFVPKIGILLDTSSSVTGDPKLHKMLIAEPQGICESMGCEVTLIHNDTRVHAVEKVSSGSQIRAKGGGGTFLIPGIEKALELGMDVLAVITDGEIGSRGLGNDPGIPVVVVLVKSNKSCVQYAEDEGWATIITIPQGELK